MTDSSLSVVEYIKHKKYTGLDDIEDLKQDFYSKYIKISYDNELVNGTRRVIFTVSKTKRMERFDKISHECNGIILEAPSWKPVCITTPNPISNIKNSIAGRLLSKGSYAMYEITNGSVINLYFWNNKWTISTFRGFDMNTVVLKTADNKTFIDILEEALYNTNLPKKFEDFTACLSTNHCYTFIVTHPILHVLGAPNIIYVQDYDLLNNQLNYENPLFKTIQQKTITPISLKNIYINLKDALNKYLNGGTPLYGYILRCPYDIGKDHSYVILESSLLRRIRHFIYASKFMLYGVNKEFSTIVNGYLEDPTVFIKLFPKYNPVFEELKHLQQELIKDIITILKKDEFLNKIEDTQKNNTKETCALFLAYEVHKLINIKLYKNPEDHILKIINNPRYIDVYISLYAAINVN